jgi:hypothetical protein
MPGDFPLSYEAIRSALASYASPTASNLAEFEAALLRATDIYAGLTPHMKTTPKLPPKPAMI